MVILTNIIWISSNENSEKIKKILKDLEASLFSKIKINLLFSINEATNILKNIKFEETIIIVNGDLYIKFIEQFQKNLNYFYIIPIIIIFTKNKEEFINKNRDYKKIINHPFYNSGGIKSNLNEIYQFILNPICTKKKLFDRDDDKQLVFEYIDSKEKLLLPMLYKTLIGITSNDKIEKFTHSLCTKYYKKSIDLDIILNSLKNVTEIPIELLSKYYTRIYTDEESEFFLDMNRDLRENKKDNYLSYIKVLYEGVRLQSLPISQDKILYRGSLLANKEIEKIKKYLNNKIKDLPGAIVFSKAFLSFSKDKKIAQNFLNAEKNNNKELCKVMYILEKDDNINYSLSTHADLEKLSFFEEKEVLFFPFSSFEIKSINEMNVNNERIFEIKLLYLGKYIKKFKEDKTINEKENIIPKSEFKKEIIRCGLISSETINKNNNNKELIKKYDEYKEKIIKNKIENENCDIKKMIKKIEINERENKKNNENNNILLTKSNEINKNNNIINKEKNDESNKDRMKRLINIFNSNKNEDKNKDNAKNYSKNEDKNKCSNIFDKIKIFDVKFGDKIINKIDNRIKDDNKNEDKIKEAININKNLINKELYEKKYKEFIKEFKNNKYSKILFMIGGGVNFSKESIIFKNKNDYYEKLNKRNIFELEHFLKNPEDFYEFMKSLNLDKFKPNIFYKFMNFFVHKNKVKYIFTQNVDGLEIKAKIPNEKIVFVHGNSLEGHCPKCKKPINIDKINEAIKKGVVYFCPICGGPCKPNIVFFGESLAIEFFEKIEECQDIDLIIIIGTYLTVSPFSEIPELTNKNSYKLLFNDAEFGNFHNDNLEENSLLIQGENKKNIIKFLNDTNLLSEFAEFLKREYNEELN